MEEMSRRSLLELEALMKKKLLAAGLPEAAASETAAHLTFADACGSILMVPCGWTTMPSV